MADFDPRWGDAIASIETGGQASPYSSITPNPGGRRALGKYQVMEENLPEWTSAALGRPLNADQFLADPKAQEAVFQHRFGGYVDKYGSPQHAASAWFTGRSITTESSKASDSLGTTGSSYVAKFDKYLGNTDGPTAIQQAMKKTGGSAPMAFADDDTGALSTGSTIGPGVLMAGGRNAAPGSGLENGLQGAAAALASVYSPQQGALIAGLRKDPADQGYSLHQMQNGTVMRINKNGRVDVLPGNYGKKDTKETAYQTARAKANSDLYDKIGTDAQNSDVQLANITKLQEALSNPDVYQGKNGEMIAGVKNLASSLGFDVKGLKDTQVAQALMNQMTLGMRQYAGGMPGSLSDKDLDFLKNMAASLNSNPDANREILGHIAKVHNRAKEVVKLRDEYAKAHGGLDDGFSEYLKQFSNKNQLFPDATAPVAAPTAPTNRPPLTSIFGK